MTEDDAKTKWCPMFRIVDIEGGISNMPHQSPHNSRCIASDCMMWRWDKTRKQNLSSGNWEPLGDKSTGYCGLAGKL